MVFALVAVVVIAGAACAVLARAKGEAERRRAEAESRRSAVEGRLAAVTAERDELRGSQEWLTAANARVTSDADRQRERADGLAAELEEARRARAATGPDGDGIWYLLLGHVARRWAAVVGVPPDGRGVVNGPARAQLTEAVSREVERLREEVGVDLDLLVDPLGPPPAGPRLGDDPADRVPVLLAAVELLGVLASTCQFVTVQIGEALVLVGEGRLDPDDELATVRDRVMAAGAAVGPLDVDDEAERVEVAVRPTAESLSEPVT